MSEPESIPGPETLERDTDQGLVSAIVDRIHDADTLEDVMPLVMPDILAFMRSERVTVYQKTQDDKEIVSRFKVQDNVNEIRVPLSTTSIAGFVALTQRPLAIANVYNPDELTRFHPKLRFDTSFDRRSGFKTRSMLVVPIKYKEVLVGVLQAINRTGGGSLYTGKDLRRATLLAHLLGQKLRYELILTGGPFENLVDSGLVSREQLEEIQARAEATDATVTSMLITEAKLLPVEIGASLERYHQVPYMAYDVNRQPPEELMVGLKRAYLRKRLWVPVDGSRESAVVLAANPSDAKLVQEIESVLEAERYELRVGLPEDVLAYLGDKIPFFEQAIEVGSTNVRELIQRLTRITDAARRESRAGGGLADGASLIVELLDRLIFDAYEKRASDIHLEPGKERDPMQIRYRIDGACLRMYQVPAEFAAALVSRIKVVAELDISERRRPQDGKLRLKAGEGTIELRVAILPSVHGESAVLRILAQSKPLPLPMLGFSEANLARVEHIISQPHGFVLVVGPTGSGKTTTLHGVLRHINTPDKKIWTAEDPVEITQPGLQQIQVRHKIGLDFASALRAFLRADPDIIMIGEMRDRETAAAMIEASLTGHLVFSTLHTNSAPETVIRLLGLGIEPTYFVDAFRGILAQRLVRTLCEHCKQEYRPDHAEIEQIRERYGLDLADELGVDWQDLRLYRPDGCEHCHGTGYRGRIAIHELLTASPELTEAIATGETHARELAAIGMRTGMRTLLQDGIVKMLQGHTDWEQLRRVVVA